jgi:hypothetical protein
MLENSVILLLCYSCLYLCVLVHAVMRTITGQLLGFKVYQAWVGSSEWRWNTIISGAPWHFSPIPFGGYIHLHPVQMSGLRWRGSLMTLVVLASDLAMMWALVQLWSGIEIYFSSKNEGPVSAFLFFTLFIRGLDILIHFLPAKVRVDGLTYPTEGCLLLEYITGRYAKSWGPKFIFRETYQRCAKRYDPDFSYRASWIWKTTQEERTLFGEANIAVAAGNHKALIEKYHILLQNPKLVGGERAFLLDSIASTAVMEDCDVVPGRALEWAREAQALVPHIRTVRGTLGAALVQTGVYAEAIELLIPLTTPDNDETDRVISSLFLAKACDHQGDAHQAALWLSRAGKPEALAKLHNRIISGLSPETRARLTQLHRMTSAI